MGKLHNYIENNNNVIDGLIDNNNFMKNNVVYISQSVCYNCIPMKVF